MVQPFSAIVHQIVNNLIQQSSSTTIPGTFFVYITAHAVRIKWCQPTKEQYVAIDMLVMFITDPPVATPTSLSMSVPPKVPRSSALADRRIRFHGNAGLILFHFSNILKERPFFSSMLQ